MKYRKLILIFTRDFAQWINQMARDEYIYSFPKVWGRSLEDQITIYNGRSSMWFRYEDDMGQLKEYMVRKSLRHYIFEQKTHRMFRKNIDIVRKLIAIPPRNIKNPVKHLHDITSFLTKEYSLYALGVFLPGPWKELFIKKHAKEKKLANQIIKRAFASREHSEGILKELGDYLLGWVGPMLKKQGYAGDYAKFLSMEEMKIFIESGKLPVKKVLEKRTKGYVFIGGKIYSTTNPKLFLKKRGIELVEENIPSDGFVSGTVACKGGVMQGKVCVIMNSKEVQKFTFGSVLVTSMTAPDYISAMKKAKAVVTDEGGLTCHAAITARELNIPTIIGTKIATKIFKDGDMVEVDANKGIVRKI